MKKINIFSFIIVVLFFLVAIFVYNSMPDQIASHWGLSGEVNGYMSKFWGIYAIPMMSLFIFILFYFIPKIDPLKENIKKFRVYFDTFIFFILAFLFYIYILMISWNLGYRFDMGLMMIPALSILFYFTGVLLSKSQRNWFIGIRTPWTLSSDIVWEKTNKLGAKLFKILSIIILLGLLFGKFAIYFLIIPIILFIVFLVIYSYFEYQKIKSNKK